MTDLGYANAGYRRLFDSTGPSFGLGFPLTGERESTPTIGEEVRLASHAESTASPAGVSSSASLRATVIRSIWPSVSTPTSGDNWFGRA